MDRYVLTTKTGEKIAQTKANCLTEAEEFFSKIKLLTINQLLEIFIVARVQN